MKADKSSANEEIVVDGVKYVYCTGNLGVNNLVWTKHDYLYQIDAPFEEDGFFRVPKIN